MSRAPETRTAQSSMHRSTMRAWIRRISITFGLVASLGVPGAERLGMRDFESVASAQSSPAWHTAYHPFDDDISISSSCTRCDNDRFYSHRAGDAGRQLGVLIAPP